MFFFKVEDKVVVEDEIEEGDDRVREDIGGRLAFFSAAKFVEIEELTHAVTHVTLPPDMDPQL